MVGARGVVTVVAVLAAACTLKAQDAPGGSDDGGVPDADTGDDISTGRTGDGGSPSIDVPVGIACTTNKECRAGFCVGEPDFPDGYCTAICNELVEVGDACPGGSVCANLGQAVAACLDLCDDADRCRPGYHCEPLDGRTSVCVPQCRKDKDCLVGTRCDTASGNCVAYPDGQFPIGAACGTDANCASKLCVKDTGYVDGYCSDLCDTSLIGKACPGGGLCFQATSTAGTAEVCWSDCTTTRDCRPGYVCSVDGGFVTADKTGACVPKCQNFACANGYECDALGFCVPKPPAIPPPYVVDRIALGSGATDSYVANTLSGSFTLPPDTVSFVVVGATAPQGELLPVGLKAPNGRTLLDINDPRSTVWKALSFPDHPFAALFPNDPSLPVTKGSYTFSFAADRPTTATVDVLVKRGPTPRKGTLPLTLWFTRTTYPRQSPLSAATAPNEPVFQQALAKWREIYAAAGITLDPSRIVYKDVPAGVAASLGVVDSDEELAQLFAQANTYDGTGLNLFFIDQFNMPGGAGLLGISAGIPGVPSYPGLPHAGVAVALYPLYATTDPLDRADFAATMAHEAGHYLGLFHTTERRGTTFDPLDDTAECRGAERDTNFDRSVSARECQSAGADNLMFWTSDPQLVLSEKLTPEQQWVLLRNPSIQ